MKPNSELALLLVLLLVSVVHSCSDLDSTACLILQQAQPDFCSTSPLSQSACQKFCGNCPVRCYHCPDHSVQDYTTCNNITTCLPDESCMINTLYGTDGHVEHIMSCGSKKYCNGLGFGFLVGKRDAVTRDISLHCCQSDLCNTPNFVSTAPPSTAAPIIPYPVKIHEDWKKAIENIVGKGENADCYRDIVFVIDESIRVNPSSFRHEIDYVIGVVERLDIGTHGDQNGEPAYFRSLYLHPQVSLLVYDETPHLQWYLNEYITKAELLTALTYVPYHDGSSRTDLALEFVREKILQYATGDRPSAKNTIILVTDGKSNIQANTLAEAQKLHTADTNVIAIGVGDGSAKDDLKNVASDYSHALLALRYEDLAKAIPLTMNLLC